MFLSSPRQNKIFFLFDNFAERFLIIGIAEGVNVISDLIVYYSEPMIDQEKQTIFFQEKKRNKSEKLRIGFG